MVSAGATWLSASERGSLLGIRITVWFYRLFGRRLSSLFILPIVGYFLLTDRKGRAASRRYLDRLYAEPDARGVLSRPPTLWNCFLHYREFALSILDRLSFWLGDTADLEITFHGQEHFARLIEQKRGAILLGAHIGSFDALRVLAARGRVVVNVLMFTRHAQRINSLFSQINPAAELRVIHLSPPSIRPVFAIKERVERGEFVAILGDRVGIEDSKRVTRVPFLGKRAPFPQGPFLLAAALQCPVLLIVGLRLNATTYEVFAESLTERASLPEATRTERMHELVEAYAKRLEAFCARAPYQWFNFYDFWGEEAEGAP
jgi:predicted LPLAT superfamily acyltransferase